MKQLTLLSLLFFSLVGYSQTISKNPQPAASDGLFNVGIGADNSLILRPKTGPDSYVKVDPTTSRLTTYKAVAEVLSLATVASASPLVINTTDLNKGGTFGLDATDTATPNDGVLTLVTASGLRYKRIYEGAAKVQWWDVYGDGFHDDRAGIVNALASEVINLDFPKTTGSYILSDAINLNGFSRKKLTMTGAVFRGTGTAGSYKRLFIFANANDIYIEGGDYGQLNAPTGNGGNSQHVFEFVNCQRVYLNHVNVHDSPEMGAAFTGCADVWVTNSVFKRCFRDGTFAQNSRHVHYLNNTYEDISDDAMSFHDVGNPTQRSLLVSLGYNQAGDFEARGNTVVKAYQGLSSIGSENVTVENNHMYHTVNAGIAVTTATVYAGFTCDTNSLAKNIIIRNNWSYYACSTVTINGVSSDNTGQATTGRAAIAVVTLGPNGQINSGETRRSSNVTIEANQVYYSGADGLDARRIDQVTLINNKFVNCAGSNPAHFIYGNVAELYSLTDHYDDGNIFLDTRSPVAHVYGIDYEIVSGFYGKIVGRGYTNSLRYFGQTPTPSPAN